MTRNGNITEKVLVLFSGLKGKGKKRERGRWRRKEEYGLRKE